MHGDAAHVLHAQILHPLAGQTRSFRRHQDNHRLNPVIEQLLEIQAAIKLQVEAKSQVASAQSRKQWSRIRKAVFSDKKTGQVLGFLELEVHGALGQTDLQHPFRVEHDPIGGVRERPELQHPCHAPQ